MYHAHAIVVTGLHGLVNPKTRLTVTNKERPIFGDRPAMCPVPLAPPGERTHENGKKPYDVLYIQRPSWLWQTNRVPFSETAPPCAQFHLDIFGYGMF